VTVEALATFKYEPIKIDNLVYRSDKTLCIHSVVVEFTTCDMCREFKSHFSYYEEQ